MIDVGTRVPLGRSRVLVSRMGLGGAPLGGLFAPVDEHEATATVDAAWAAGIRYFDTAPLYGSGLSEQRLGRALRHRPGAVVSTKVGRVLVPGRPDPIFHGAPALAPRFDFSADGVRRSLEASLERLSRDRVDVVLVHDPDDHERQALDEAFPALFELRAQGVIGAVGAGMNQAGMLTRFVDALDLDCVLVAGRYTLLDQRGLDELLPRCARRGVSVIAAGVFNSGLLADPRPGATFDYAPAPAELVARARRVAEICAGHDVPVTAAALQFAAAHPAVACVLPGARSPAEVAANVAAARVPVPAALWDDLRDAGVLRPDAPVPAGPPG